MPSRRLTDDERQRIVERYKAGDSIEAMMADMRVSRATVYYTLDKMNVPRDRQPRAEIPDNVGDSPEQTLAWALRTIMEQEREIGHCRRQIEERDERIAVLLDRLFESRREE